MRLLPLLLLLCLTACGTANVGTDKPGKFVSDDNTIFGHLYLDGDPYANAPVLLDERRVTESWVPPCVYSSYTGLYVFNDVPPGDYIVKVWDPDDDVWATAEVHPPSEIDFYL